MDCDSRGLDGPPTFIDDLAAADSLPDRVASIAAATPEKPFLILQRNGASVTTTYAGLLARAHGYAAAYRRLRLAPGAPVVLMTPPHPDLAPAFLGAMIAGAVPSIFPPTSPKQGKALFWRSQTEVFERIGVQVVVTDAGQAAELSAHMPEAAARVLQMDQVPDAAPAPATLAPEGVAFLQHSSGTTGTKKGVVLTHRAVLDAVASLAMALCAREDDVVASWLPLYHDMGLIGCLTLPMALGLTVVQLDPFEWALRPATLLDAIRDHRATLCWMPNFAFHHILRSAPDGSAHDLSSMRAFIDCSEPCKPDTLRAFAERFAPAGLRPEALQVSYAMAENVFGVTQTGLAAAPRSVRADMRAFGEHGVIREPEADAPALEFLSAGAPIPGTRLRITDAEGAPLPDRRVGQIAIASPYMFAGYFRQPFPEAKFAQGWYLTGDLGFTDAGETFVCGRTDDLLIINGRNIHAHDVEHAVNEGAAVKGGRCVAIGPFSRRLGSQALVVIAETAEAEPAARAALARSIRSLVQTVFGATVFDVRVTDVGWLIKTTSGKIGRGANERKYLAEFPLA
jgi:acyl-CoA synthetase (AMP-forming)/AMP-acid ligase II